MYLFLLLMYTDVYWCSLMCIIHTNKTHYTETFLRYPIIICTDALMCIGSYYWCILMCTDCKPQTEIITRKHLWFMQWTYGLVCTNVYWFILLMYTDVYWCDFVNTNNNIITRKHLWLCNDNMYWCVLMCICLYYWCILIVYWCVLMCIVNTNKTHDTEIFLR